MVMESAEKKNWAQQILKNEVSIEDFNDFGSPDMEPLEDDGVFECGCHHSLFDGLEKQHYVEQLLGDSYHVINLYDYNCPKINNCCFKETTHPHIHRKIKTSQELVCCALFPHRQGGDHAPDGVDHGNDENDDDDDDDDIEDGDDYNNDDDESAE
ncbi:protein PFC0760c-like [Fopius arisanus]|uniref:Protein PFC0760c-like n=1 Tax=Fopius arisanus TaxID=64838 RepID=A0A9R1TP30_9HYME|nr:PREDICTED: protein PFC0760c-like [Fopius arisanus]